MILARASSFSFSIWQIPSLSILCLSMTKVRNDEDELVELEATEELLFWDVPLASQDSLLIKILSSSLVKLSEDLVKTY